MSHTVRCALCLFEHNRRCVKKKNKVKINKPRHCIFYVESKDKLELLAAKQKQFGTPKVTVRPDSVWDGKYVREWDGTRYVKVKDKERINELKASLDTEKSTATTLVQSYASSNPKHPLTGDLSRFFKSTVDSKE